MRKLKFVRAVGGYAKGQVAEIAGGLADRLIAQGAAVEERQQDLIETAAVEPVAETADATPRRVKRAVSKPRSSDRPGR